MSKTDRIHLVAPSTILNKGDAAIYVGALNLITQCFPRCKISLSVEGYTEHNNLIKRMFDFKDVDITEGLLQGIKKVLMNTVNMPELFFKNRSPKGEKTSVDSLRNNPSSFRDFHTQLHLFKYFQIPFLLTKIIEKSKVRQEPFGSLRKSNTVVILGHNLTRSCLANSLLSYSVPKLVFGKKTVIFPISISQYSYSNLSITNALLQSYTRFILEKMDCIMLREMSSLVSLRERLHVSNKNVFFGADTAFLLPKGDSKKMLNIIHSQGIKIEKPALAVCIRGRNYFNTYRNYIEVDYFSFIRNLAKVLDTLIEKLDINVYFVPMTMLEPQGLDDYDYQGALRIHRKMSQKSQACVINTRDMTPNEIAVLLERMDFVLTMRLHQLITASTVGVPSVLVLPAQELKAVGIMKTLGLDGYLVNLGDPSHLLYRNTLDKVTDGFANRDMLAQTIKSRLPSIRKKVSLAGKILASLVSVN